MSLPQPQASRKFPTKEVFVPALKIGALTGSAGLLTGATASILRSSPTPTLFTLASSIQWFLLGSTFWATRSTLLFTLPPGRLSHSLFSSTESSNPVTLHAHTPTDRLRASTISGGITGLIVAAITRGRRNVIPATLFWGAVGYVGQRSYTFLDERHSEQVITASTDAGTEGRGKEDGGFWKRLAEMKWSPMRSLSDEEYGGMLRKRLLSLEAQIALVDEEIERLRGEETGERAKEVAQSAKEQEEKAKPR